MIYVNKNENKNKRLALVDVDGVILNFQEGIRSVLSEKGIIFNIDAVRTYDYEGDVGCDRKLIFNEFRNPKVYETAPYLPKAILGLMRLNSVATTHAYTGSVPDIQIVGMREALCNKLPFDAYTIFTGEHKGIKLSEDDTINDTLKPDVVFDDCPAVINMWCETDIPYVYVIDAPYNKECEGRCIRANNFYEAVLDYINRIK